MRVSQNRLPQIIGVPIYNQGSLRPSLEAPEKGDQEKFHQQHWD